MSPSRYDADIARLHGQIDALQDDDVYLDALCAVAWFRHDPELPLRLSDGRPTGMPPAVNGDETVQADVTARRGPLTAGTPADNCKTPSALVERFHSALGEGGP